MAKLYNLAAMTVASTGTGTITLGSAATINGVLYLSFAGAGVVDGETVAYSINDVGASEVGTGVYTAAGTTLSRTPVTSTNANAAINMSAAAIVRISPAKADIANLRENNTFTGTQSITNTTASSSYNSGALTVAGGLGVANRAFIGDGTSANAGAVNLDAPTSANQGAAAIFRRGGVALFAFGNYSGILGGTSNDFVVYSYTTGAGVTPAIHISDATGALTVESNFGTTSPTTKTANYSLTATDNSLIFNGSGSITLTLQAASSYPGRWLMLKNIAAFTVVSASSNVVPQAGGAAGTAILAATAGKWALLQSDGSNWQIMMSN